MGVRGTSSGPARGWVIGAAAVALVATAGALRLFAEAVENGWRAEDYPASASNPGSPEGGDLDAGSPSRDSIETDLESPVDRAPDPIEIRTTVDGSVRVSRFLEQAGLQIGQVRRWTDTFQGIARSRILTNRHRLSVYKDPETGDLRGFRYDLDDHTEILQQGYANGVIRAERKPIRYVTVPVKLAFAIRDTFEREVARRSIPKPIVESLEDAFKDRRPVDDLPAGSGLKLIYDVDISLDKSHRLVRDLKAAQMSVGGRTFHAFAFSDEHGRAHLYDEHGKALGPQVLRFPLPFEYISSGFNTARYHPILHRYRPHVGIDLVAQYGTPVKAIADGKVESSDWAGELGKCVRLGHDHDTVSIYGHLSRISPVLKPGSYVKVGQVIGYVGSTGLSTGPHLHFALLHEGRYVNPLSRKLGENHEVSPRLRAVFDSVRQRYQTLLAKLPDLGTSRVAVGARKPAISRWADMYHVQLKHRFSMHRRLSHA